MQLPGGGIGNLHHIQLQGAQHAEVDAGVAPHVGGHAEQIHRHRDAALRQRTRDNEPVAAVVTLPAQDGHVQSRQILEGGFHRRHDLPAGILHQHQ